MLDAARLRELLSYDAQTGVFRWLDRKGPKEAGDVAGCLTPKGYLLIGIDGQLYLAHRLAWLYVHGVFPEKDVDHRDRNKSNNRIDNLRQATSSQNAANTGVRSTNRSGFKGVSWDAKNQRWRATLTVDGKQRSLGRHERLESAVAAYRTAVQSVHATYAAGELGVTFYELEAA